MIPSAVTLAAVVLVMRILLLPLLLIHDTLIFNFPHMPLDSAASEGIMPEDSLKAFLWTTSGTCCLKLCCTLLCYAVLCRPVLCRPLFCCIVMCCTASPFSLRHLRCPGMVANFKDSLWSFPSKSPKLEQSVTKSKCNTIMSCIYWFIQMVEINITVDMSYLISRILPIPT